VLPSPFFYQKAIWLCLLLALAACIEPSATAPAAAPSPRGNAAREARDQRHAIPVTNESGRTRLLQARLCRPAGEAPARLVIINHGSPPDAAARPRVQLGSCRDAAAQWFLTRGYAVLFALRRGYGSTGGDWAESYGSCAKADYVHAGLETARDIAALADYGTALPSIRPNGVVVVGQSAGGWGAIAYASRPHPKVAAFIVMAGGRGGHQNNHPNQNCRPDRLAEAAGRYDATAETPMLWVYAANDSYFSPAIATSLHDAFIAAGGKATLVQPGPFGGDGHRLFFGDGGSAIWGPLFERYLADRLGGAT